MLDKDCTVAVVVADDYIVDSVVAEAVSAD